MSNHTPTIQPPSRNCSRAFWRAGSWPLSSTSLFSPSRSCWQRCSFSPLELSRWGLDLPSIGCSRLQRSSGHCSTLAARSDSATVGMRVMDLEMRTWYGAPAYFVLGAVHAIAFWFTVSFFTPFVLLVAFFNERRRLLHDILLGTVIINKSARASMLRPSTQAVRAE